ncbi:MaoC/PaaZ C-terminal domain-containing protein [Effusibacillus consociatus]|uniref:MaoC/PaaZ C-terminal domain-containing protein n=1 Tax=Effusibacillus consociatus TaxID=1117041 RepID=A0ABV9Q3D0_9BACL
MTAKPVQAGDTIGPLVKPPVTKTQLVMYSGASGDFNPIHTVEEFAQEAGLGGVIAHGMLTMAFVGQLVTETIGIEGDLLKFGVRFTGMVRPGDLITCEGKVLETRIEGDRQFVRCEVWAANQKGDKVVAGQAEYII